MLLLVSVCKVYVNKIKLIRYITIFLLYVCVITIIKYIANTKEKESEGICKENFSKMGLYCKCR